jgi:hypothetical protein
MSDAADQFIRALRPLIYEAVREGVRDALAAPPTPGTTPASGGVWGVDRGGVVDGHVRLGPPVGGLPGGVLVGGRRRNSQSRCVLQFEVEAVQRPPT